PRPWTNRIQTPPTSRHAAKARRRPRVLVSIRDLPRWRSENYRANRLSTLAVIRETDSSTSRLDGQQIEPAENTPPPRGVSKYTVRAPPSSGFVPWAIRWILAGELGDILSVSWPEAPPGIRSCRL